VGFGRILSTGSTPEILELFELLSHRFSPDDPPIGRDEKSAHDASSNIHQQIYAEFKDSFQTNGKKLLFDNVPKSAGALNDDICRSLDRVIPWETEHFPATKQARRTSYERMAAEMAIAHVCIDQHRCLEEVKRDNQRISRYFDAWKVPIANSAEPTEPAEKPRLRWNDVEARIIKEIHRSEKESKSGLGSMFEIIVDGELTDCIADGAPKRIDLPSAARYVEIRDAESRTMVANCHLMDPRDLPEGGWKTSVDVKTCRVNLEFFLDQLRLDQSGTGAERISMRIRVDFNRGWIASFRSWTSRVLKEQLSRGRSLAIAGGMLSVAIALSITSSLLSREAARLRARIGELQLENSDLQSQVADIPMLREKIAELQRHGPGTVEPDPAAVQSDPGLKLSEILHDGSRVVGLDATGNLARAEWIPPEFQAMVQMALATGRIEVPRSLPGRQTAKLMGGGAGSESFALVSPVGVVVEEDRPTLHWKPLKGATSYTVTISDSGYREVASAASINRTNWTLDRRLKRGELYWWQVTALKNGEEIKAPGRPGVLARFQVMSHADAEKLAQARKTHSDSHLVMGLLYARVGLRVEAERQFKALRDANPTSTVSRMLLRNIRKAY